MTIARRPAVVAAIPVALVVAADPGGLAPFGPVKALALFALVPLAAALWLRGAIRVDRASAIAWLAFLGVAGLAAAAGFDDLYAWIGTPERHFGWLTWVMCAVAFVVGQQLDTPAARLVARATGVAIGVAGAWALAEWIGWHPIALAGAGARPVGPLGSSAFLGAAAVLLGPAAIAGARRRAAWLGGGLAGVALVASGARAAWVGALVAGAIWTLVRHGSRRVAGGVLFLAVAGTFAFGVAGRLPDLARDRDGGVHGRVDEWRVAVRVVGDHPVLGVGPEGYRIAFGRVVDATYEQRHGRDPLPDRAHNALLDVAATTGLVGVAAYLVLVAITGRALFRVVRGGDPLPAAIAVGVVGYSVQSLFLFPVAELEPIAWLLAGIAIAHTVTTAARVPRALSLAAACLAAVGLVGGTLGVVADRRAHTTLAALADGRLPHGDGARRLRPDVLSYQLLAARAAAARGTPSGFADALAAVERARAISPGDPVARAEQARFELERARLSGDRRDIARARATLERLVVDDPQNAEAWLRLGVSAALGGDDGRAEAAWQRATRLAPRSAAAPADLAVAYARRGRWDEARAAARTALAREPSNQPARDVLRQADGTGSGP